MYACEDFKIGTYVRILFSDHVLLIRPGTEPVTLCLLE